MKALLKRRQVYAQKHKRSRLRRRIVSFGVSFSVLIAFSFVAAVITNAKRHTQPKPSHTTVISAGITPHVDKKSATKIVPPVVAPEIATTVPAQTLGASTATCVDKKAPNVALAASSDSQLRKLAEYDALLCSGAISTSYIFSSMPTTNAEADVLVSDVSARLSAFAAANLTPIVIVEPQNRGTNLDLANLQNSGAGSVYEYFLNALKAKGVTDSEAGTWVFFPEPNIPEWSTVDPTVFTANFTTFGMLFKEYFKTAKLSIMLDSTSYHTNSYDSSGAHSSLLPYVSSLPSELVDSLGYQGFPWSPAANETGSAVTDAADFLEPSLAVEAAHALGVHDVWLNTGTFASTYTNDSAKKVQFTAQQRSSILSSIATQAVSLQKSGFTVSLNLFSENKSADPEAIDWSYWPAGKATGSDGAALFSTFADKLQGQGVSLGVYDTF